MGSLESQASPHSNASPSSQMLPQEGGSGQCQDMQIKHGQVSLVQGSWAAWAQASHLRQLPVCQIAQYRGLGLL